MRKLLRILGYAIALIVLAIGGFLAYVALTGIPKYPPGKIDRKVEVTPERVARGRKIASLSCFNCHANATTRRLTGKRLDDAPKEFGPIYSKNITKDPAHGIGTWTDGELIYLLRTGSRPKGAVPASVHAEGAASCPTRTSSRSSRSCARTIPPSRPRPRIRRESRSRPS
jgi:hypothetical protein